MIVKNPEEQPKNEFIPPFLYYRNSLLFTIIYYNYIIWWERGPQVEIPERHSLDIIAIYTMYIIHTQNCILLA